MRAPDTPVTAVKTAQRDGGGDVLQIVAARADHLDLAVFFFGLRRSPGTDTREFAGKILAGQRSRVRQDVLRRALRHDLAAVHAGRRTDVDHVVGRQDRILVVLDDDHRVADIAQVRQRVEQPRVVALVQADRRLVENVEHACQARADLRWPDGCAGFRRPTVCRNSRDRLRYSRPTSFRKRRRSRISLRMRTAISSLLGRVKLAGSASNQSRATPDRHIG